MHNEHVHTHRIRIEKAIYSNRINVALEIAEKKKEYTTFKKNLQEGLKEQILFVAKEEKISRLLNFTKVAATPLIKEVAVLLSERSITDYVNLKAFLIFSGTEGGQAAVDKLGLTGTFVLKNNDLISFFSDYENLLIKQIDEYTHKWIANQIQKGKDNSLSASDIALSLINESKGISKVRAERIAITELANAMVKVELVAAKKYGITEIVWRTSRDELVCPICLPLDGEKSKISQSFDGYIIPAHPSCRCFYEEVIPSLWEPSTDIWLGE